MLWGNIKIIATLFCGWIFLYFLYTFVIQIMPEIIYRSAFFDISRWFYNVFVIVQYF